VRGREGAPPLVTAAELEVQVVRRRRRRAQLWW
jgi:hypothetical protein